MLGLRKKDPTSTIAVHVSTKKKLDKISETVDPTCKSYESIIKFLIEFYKIKTQK